MLNCFAAVLRRTGTFFNMSWDRISHYTDLRSVGMISIQRAKKQMSRYYKIQNCEEIIHLNPRNFK